MGGENFVVAEGHVAPQRLGVTRRLREGFDLLCKRLTWAAAFLPSTSREEKP